MALLHIPLELYPYFHKSILRLIFDEIPSLEDTCKKEGDMLQDVGESEKNTQPAFMNVSITPVEISVICPRRLVVKYFDPLLSQLDQVDSSLRSRLVISESDYIAMQVLGQGLEAGKRVLELTSPLAMAGMYDTPQKYMHDHHTDLTFQLDLLHFHLFFRLHPRSPLQQDKRDGSARKPRLPTRQENRYLRQRTKHSNITPPSKSKYHHAFPNNTTTIHTSGTTNPHL